MTIVYFIFLLSAAYCSFRYDGVEEQDAHKEHRFWLLCIMLICISGFSYGLGGDKFAYLEAFEQMPEHIDSLSEYISFNVLRYSYMPFWTLLNIFAKSCFDSFYVVQFIQSAVINVAFCYVIRRYTKRQFLFLIVYFLSEVYFQFNMEVMREGFSIAICMLAIESYMDGKRLRYALLILVAVMFHLSAVVALAFPICRVRISRWLLPAMFFLSAVVWALSDFILSHAASFALGGIGILVQKVLTYSFQASTIFGFLRSAITFMILPFIVMYYSVKWEDDEERKTRKEKLVSFYLLLSFLACSFAGFSRFRNYAEIYNLMFFADFLYIWLRTKEHFVVRTFTIVGIVFLTSLKYFVYFPVNKAYFYQLFVPYTCILDEDPGVYYRASIHLEATEGEISDKNTRKME